MRSEPKRIREITDVATEIASAAWRRFLRGPAGSVGIARLVATWMAYIFVVMLSVAAGLRTRPPQVTLWWLLLLAWLVSNVAGAAREQKHHDPRAWAGVALVFLVSGMAVPPAWYSVGLALLIAAAIHSWPVEWAFVFVQRTAGWATAALIWVGAWRLLTNLGLAVLGPVMRAVNPRGSSVLSTVLSALSAVLSAGAALAVLWLLFRGYRRLREQQEAVT